MQPDADLFISLHNLPIVSEIAVGAGLSGLNVCVLNRSDFSIQPNALGQRKLDNSHELIWSHPNPERSSGGKPPGGHAEQRRQDRLRSADDALVFLDLLGGLDDDSD